MAQPALTRAIKLLEDEFGGLLLHRERARTHLSELGQAVRSYLEEVLRQSQQAKRLATSFIELKGTPLKLGIMCTIGPSNFVGLLTSLQAQYPGSAVAGCGCAGGAQEPRAMAARCIDRAITAVTSCGSHRGGEIGLQFQRMREHSRGAER